MNEILSFAIIAVVGLFSVSVYLYRQNGKKIEAIDELKNDLDNNNELLNTKNIELATYKEKLTQLDPSLQKIKDFEILINEKQIELSNTKEESSKYKTSLDEQKEKYTDFKITSDKRLDELKEELQQQKVQISKYNDEIKHDKALISELETKVLEEKKSSEKLSRAKEIYITELKQSLETLEADKKELQTQVNQDKATVSQLQTQREEQNKAMEEKVKLLQNSEAKLKTEFENLANKIFDSNSKKFTQQNQESLGLILNPMKQQLTDFKKKVEDVYDKEAKDRSALSAELKMLKELNQKMTTEAHNLTNALKHDNKTQGGWGEMVLDKVLESSGLREGHEFTKQVSLRDDEDKLFKPDVVVNLPDNRHIIIDAKTSLTAYNEYRAEADDNLKLIHLKNHIKSVKDHIKGLSNKKYEDLKNVNSLDFIFMFLPIESALLLALENDVNLYDEAFKQKIILVSPTTLLVALRAVENTWRYERQAQNIADVYKRAEELYKKFTGFVDDLKKVDKGLESARTNYDEAFKKLSGGRGNLITQVTMLKKVSNIKPKKELDSALVEGAMMDGLEDQKEIGE
ncbi:DNA recombination protein RmuC [Sulfurimonas sp.]|uniref:DNA recombination protein RmuC n=1 Tax=Sulfurimonas sp. TaxID=2022749 RepID=UPI002621189E|nr:DNA recombination protein RmuC [Sulfurimonas sp.]MCW8895007.1 DNA recombination protein RmuC [Sulfurimonas sp.]